MTQGDQRLAQQSKSKMRTNPNKTHQDTKNVVNPIAHFFVSQLR